jgi:hypothetical protein
MAGRMVGASKSKEKDPPLNTAYPFEVKPTSRPDTESGTRVVPRSSPDSLNTVRNALRLSEATTLSPTEYALLSDANCPGPPPREPTDATESPSISRMCTRVRLRSVTTIRPDAVRET